MGSICCRCGWIGSALFSPDDGDAWPFACPVCESEDLAYYGGPVEGSGPS